MFPSVNLFYANKFKRLFSLYSPHILLISLGAFLIPFIYIESLLDKSVLPKYAFVALISVLSFLAWLINSWRDNKLQFNSIFYLLLLIYCFSVLSIVWSEFVGLYNLEVIKLSSFLLLSFTCLQISQFKDIKFILSLSVAGATSIVIVTFIQVWGWNIFSYVISEFPAASFINKNHLANYVDLFIPICLTLLIISKNNCMRWLYAFCISFLFSFIIISHTRASWLSLCIILTSLLLFSKKIPELRKRYLTVPASIIIFIIIFTGILSSSSPNIINETNRFASMYSSQTNNSISVRLNALKNATDMIKTKPIAGVGLGSFYQSYKPYNFQSSANSNSRFHLLHLHNDVLQIIVELGIIGGILYFIFIGLFFKKVYVKLTFPNNSKPDKNILYLGMFLALLSTGVHSLLSFPLHLPASYFFIILLVGLLLNLNSKIINKKLLVIVTLAIFSLTFSYFSYIYFQSYISSSYYLNTAIKSIYSTSSFGTPVKLKKTPPLESDCQLAKDLSEQSLNNSNNDYYIHSWAHTIYIQCEKSPHKILMFAEKILSKDPYHFASLESTSRLYFEEGNYEKAKIYSSQLHSLYPLNSRYTLWLGHIAARQKNYQRAIEYYQKTLQLEPGNQAAKKMIEQINLL